jgi:hypothetical protein
MTVQDGDGDMGGHMLNFLLDTIQDLKKKNVSRVH